MGADAATSVTAPARKRDSWSLKTIVEDVAGRPLNDFQEPGRPVHPYVKLKLGDGSATPVPPPASGLIAPLEPEEFDDPVARVYPPLTGATGRSLHGKDHEHPAAMLPELGRAAEPGGPGTRPHPPGPSRRPERVYLHYLLLHIDRLSDTALRYLHRAVEEEITHREASLKAHPPAGP